MNHKMLTTFSVILLVVLLAPGAYAEQREGKGRSHRGDRCQHHRSAMFHVLDADHDGVLSSDEIDNAAKALKKLDKNDDGRLTRKELRPQRRRGERAERGERGARDLRSRDRDDGYPRFDPDRDDGPRRFDRDRRGPRRGEGRDGPPSVDDIFDRFDKNEDGKLTEDEMPQRAQRRLEKADDNDDGAITKDELRSFREDRARNR